MTDKDRRKELLARVKQAQPEAGVCRLVNRANNKALLGATPNLASIRGKLEFACSTNSPGVLDRRPREDIHQNGIAAFSLEMLEVLDVEPGATPAEIQADPRALKEPWRERLDPALLY